LKTDTILRSIKNYLINYSDWHLLQLKNQGFNARRRIYQVVVPPLADAEQHFETEFKESKNLLRYYGYTCLFWLINECIL
jgi:hypothetical protein